MIPRLHRRGTSFKGALGYVLHDPGKESSERVAWVDTQNIYSDPKDAWFEMFDTYRNRTILKRNAGVELRGRDNKAPVLHYTLSWHASDNPDPEHMRAMAFDSLRALGLSEHEAVIACHQDKEHHHVHVVVNTVHPYTGRTAALKFSKLEFSKWAEAYEREHGIHCEQRIKNNERRRQIAKLREGEKAKASLALLTGQEPPEPAPFLPVNDNSPNRRRWFERKEVVDKMKALRAALDQEHKAERGETWARQKADRDALDRKTHAALDKARGDVRETYKPKWRDLYQMQKREARRLKESATHPLERAVFLFTNRARLGDRGKPLSLRRMIPLILSGRKLKARVEQIHMRERRALAREEKGLARQRADQLWQMHRAEFHALRDRQAGERAAEKAHQKNEQKDITFARAKAELIREEDEPAADVPKAPPQPERPLAREKPKQGVPLAPKAPAKEARTLLMPGHVAGRVPMAPERQVSTEQAKALLTGMQALSQGVPRAPEKRPPKVPGPSKSFDDAARHGKAQVKSSFEKAASPKQPAKPSRDDARTIRMKKDMEKWKRRTARDDFDRER